MPYRINPADRSEVQVLKDGKWKRHFKYPRDKDGYRRAKRLLAALRFNVKE